MRMPSGICSTCRSTSASCCQAIARFPDSITSQMFLGTSPSLIQSYVSAAMKISRLAVGDLSAPPAPSVYNAVAGLSQNTHMDGLPLGTQGGMIVRHNFPLDAEYQIQTGGGRVDMTIDGMPVPTGGRGRIPIPAGPHTIGVANVPAFDSGGLDGVFSAPSPRGRGMSVTITGPYNATGPGITPSRRRIFVLPAIERRPGNDLRPGNPANSRITRVPAARRGQRPFHGGLVQLLPGWKK
jgi:hypothetical protein